MLRFVSKNIYRKDIVMVLVLKVVLLFLLWSLFFSHPVRVTAELGQWLTGR